MAFNLSGILSLDSSGFTSGISKAKSEVAGLGSEMGKTKGGADGLGNGLKGIGSSAIGSIGSVKSLIGAFAGFKAVQTAVSTVTGAIKTGFAEASDMEGYKVQLETATKDTKKAGQLMSNAIEFANKTPFETGQVVQATATMEMYGLTSERWLSDIADMAGATNKDMMQATEAMVDAGVGEFERLKEFGLSKDKIMAESAKKYGDGVVFNAKGQVMDQAKLMDTLQEMMQDSYSGGAEKLSKTTKGLWSTVTGVWKTGMASIMGISMEGETAGEIIDGSLMSVIKNGVETVATVLQNFQNNGYFKKMGESVTSFVNKGVSAFRSLSYTLAPFFDKFRSTFLPIIKDVFNVITTQIYPAFKNVAEEVFPSVGNLFQSLCDLISTLWNNVMKPVWDEFAPKVQQAADTIGPIISGLIDVITGLSDFLTNVFQGNWAGAWESIKSTVSNAISSMISDIGELAGSLASVGEFLMNPASAVAKGVGKLVGGKIPQKGEGNANGTSYFSGGYTAINERGGEIATLPNGTTIIPADRSKEMIEKGNTDNSKKDVKIYINANNMDVNQMVDVLEMRLANI
ncbi:MAG: hypothetical protein [Bacteriophage sp.]|nr:MAG: hypothetical protein [Bacteriophage sp.]UWG92260.1 MAG: hypothetical protein [Bacteriophage sp.]